MGDRSDENVKLSEEKAARVFLRAAELDGVAESALSLSQIRQIAIEAGISPRSVDLALEELAGNAPPSGPVAINDAGSVPRAPAWVRFCMFGVPDRRIATGYYWLFLAGFLALPVASLLTGNSGTGAATLGGMAFCAFALWSTSRTIRWLDQHGWASLDKKARAS